MKLEKNHDPDFFFVHTTHSTSVNTLEVMALSEHDLEIVDTDVKPQNENKTKKKCCNYLLKIINVCLTFFYKFSFRKLFASLRTGEREFIHSLKLM